MRHLRHLGRAFLLLVVITGFVVGGIRLAEQNVAGSDVAATGLMVFGGIAALFVLLLGFGKLLGRLVPSDDEDES